jgi:serine/threonine protein kinase
MIIMAYYRQGNIVDAGIADDSRYVGAMGQILDGLHAKRVVHRDLKPENFLLETKPFFKVVITDFGFAKVATNTTLLTTFCGTPKYTAPEVFPRFSDGHGPPADVWSLGVIVFEWIYGIPEVEEEEKEEEEEEEEESVLPVKWITQLLNKLEDQDKDHLVRILLRMLQVKVRKRWPAQKCLAQGFEIGLSKRRVADGLVVCASDRDDLDLPTQEGDDGKRR